MLLNNYMFFYLHILYVKRERPTTPKTTNKSSKNIASPKSPNSKRE